MEATQENLAPILPLPAPARTGHRHRAVWLIAILAACLLIAVGTAIDLSRRASPAAPPTVMVAPVTRGLVVGAVRARGVLEPIRTAVISQPVAGRLLQVMVKPGERVARGQVLARFDPLELQAEFARAEAQVVAAEVTSLEAEVKLARLDRDYQRRFGPTVPDDQADVYQIMMARAASAAAEVNAREAAYRVATRRLAARLVRSPAEGIVLSRQVEEGQLVPEGAVLFRVSADPTPLQLHATVPEADMAGIKLGQPVQFSVPAFPGRRLAGRVARIAPLRGPEGDRRLPLEIQVDGPAEGLVPDMTAQLSIQTSSEGPVVRVPTAALLFAPLGMSSGSEEPAVWLTRSASSRLERVPVTVGITDGAFAEIRSQQLRESDAVAVGYATIK
jgi:HlyD family secretion protein